MNTNNTLWLHKKTFRTELLPKEEKWFYDFYELLDDRIIKTVTEDETITDNYVNVDGDVMTGDLTAPNFIGAGEGLTDVNNYTNALAMPEDVGGLEAGTTFNNITVEEMLTSILYPYQYPTFTSFELASYLSDRYEIGVAISGSQEFIWASSNDSNINVDSINIVGDGMSGVSNLSNTGSTFITVSATRTTAGSKSWAIQGTNSKSEIFNRSNSIRWDWRMYWGTSSNESLTEANIKALASSKLVPTSTLGSYTFNAGDYKYYIIPDNSSYTKPTAFVDVGTGFAVSMYAGYGNTENGITYDVVNVTNDNAISEDYRVYRTNNPLASSIVIAIS